MNPLSHLQADWPAINRLLDEALELPPAERSAWLAALPADVSPLKDTVARLLAATGGVETGDFLHTLPKLGATGPGESSNGAQAGAEVGPWRLLREIGEGGMGSVWLAERTDGSLKRQVALKLPRLSWQRGLAERMARERDILATLEHPHIARLYDAGVDALGRPWLALEYVQGQPIDEHARNKALDVKQRVQLLLQVCEAVAYAHSRLVIHRDLKPGNILVTDDGQVKLLDFGIAKLMQGEQAGVTALTELGGRAFTLDYASPEQVRGEALTTASDVYSLGVVAYELLSGARPYRLQRGSAAELEEAITHGDIEPPSRAGAGTAAARAVRGDLDAIVLHALRRQPATRYATVQALAEDLRRHLADEPVVARPDGHWLRLRRAARRQRLWLALGGAVLLALVGGAYAQAAVVLALAAGVVAALWQRRRALEQAARAERESDAARRATAEADQRLTAQRAVSDLYIDAFSRLGVMAREQPQALAQGDAVGELLEQRLNEELPRRASDPAAQLALMDVVATQLNFMNDFERSLRISRRLLDRLTTADVSAEVVILAHTTMGSTLYHLGRFEECAQVRQAGVGWRQAEADPAAEAARAQLMSALGSVLAVLGRRAEAGRWLAKAAELLELRDPSNAALRVNLIYLATFHGGLNPALALGYARRVLAWVDEPGRLAAEDAASTLSHVASALAANGLFDEAQACLRRATVLSAEYYGADSPQRARHACLVAAMQARNGHFGEAQAQLDAWFENHHGDNEGEAHVMFEARSMEVAWLHGDLDRLASLSLPPAVDLQRSTWLSDIDQFVMIFAEARTLAGRRAAAQVLLDTLCEVLPAAKGLSSLGLRVRRARLAAMDERHGATGRAQACDGVITELEAAGGQACWTFRVAHEFAALARLETGAADAQAKATWHQQAAAAVSSALAPSLPERAESLLRQARVALSLGQTASAQTLYTEAMPLLVDQHASSPRLDMASALHSALGASPATAAPRPGASTD